MRKWLEEHAKDDDLNRKFCKEFKCSLSLSRQFVDLWKSAKNVSKSKHLYVKDI